MKIAAYVATLFVRLLGVFGLLSSGSALFGLLDSSVSMGDRVAIMLVLSFGLSTVAVLLAGRIVRLFTADAPLGNE